jgi:methionyl-tRNA formyltransferase
MGSHNLNRKLKISILCDNPRSWIIPHVHELVGLLKKSKHNVRLCSSASEITKGDVAVLLSCEEIITSEVLALSQHTLVVHESKLPKGKGMSPLTWQILEGKNKIPVTLFEAEVGVDSGVIYGQEFIIFDGTELVDDLRKKQAEATIKLVTDFVQNYSSVKGKKQRGQATYYRKRIPEDSKLDIHKTIREQFNLLRVVDNERYPATFEYRGHRYILKIYEDKR